MMKLSLNIENLHKAPVFLMSLPDKDHQVSEPRRKAKNVKLHTTTKFSPEGSVEIFSIGKYFVDMVRD